MTTSEPYVPWPVRVIAVLFVLPFRLAWELLRLAGRLLVDYVFRPLEWLLDKLIVVPLRLLWKHLLGPVLRFVRHYLIAVPLTWLGRQAARALRWIGRTLADLAHRVGRVTAPVWKAIGRALWEWVVRPVLWAVVRFFQYVLRPAWHGAGWLLARFFRYVLRPGWRGLGRLLELLFQDVLQPAWRGVGWLAGSVYRYLLLPVHRFVLRPIGVATRWVWQHTAVVAGRAVVAAGGWVNQALLRPARQTVRGIWGMFGRVL